MSRKRESILNEFPEVRLSDNSIYQGQWKDDETRHGLGLLTWPDGSKFFGYWKQHKANGFGVLHHADGDVFMGKEPRKTLDFFLAFY